LYDSHGVNGREGSRTTTAIVVKETVVKEKAVENTRSHFYEPRRKTGERKGLRFVLSWHGGEKGIGSSFSGKALYPQIYTPSPWLVRERERKSKGVEVRGVETDKLSRDETVYPEMSGGKKPRPISLE